MYWETFCKMSKCYRANPASTGRGTDVVFMLVCHVDRAYVPVDNFGTVVGENPDCLLLCGTVVGENLDHVCWGGETCCNV